jgi:hypothetical protein
MAVPDGEDEDNPQRVVVTVKSNLARKGDGYSLRVGPDPGEKVPGVSWVAKVDVKPDTLIGGSREGDEALRVEDAEVWLADYLDDGDWHARSVIIQRGRPWPPSCRGASVLPQSASRARRCR